MLNLMRYSPWREMFAMAETMNRLMTEQMVRTMTGWPMWPGPSQPLAMDVFETDESWQAEILLPGVQPNEIDVSIKGNILTITIEQAGDTNQELRDRSVYRKQPHAPFQRSITLPDTVDSETAEAAFENNILKLALKVESVPSKRVAVKAGLENGIHD